MADDLEYQSERKIFTSVEQEFTIFNIIDAQSKITAYLIDQSYKRQLAWADNVMPGLIRMRGNSESIYYEVRKGNAEGLKDFERLAELRLAGSLHIDAGEDWVLDPSGLEMIAKELQKS